MEWWLPFALIGAALLVPMLLAPQPRRRRESDEDSFGDDAPEDNRPDNRDDNRAGPLGLASYGGGASKREPLPKSGYSGRDADGVGFGALQAPALSKPRRNTAKTAPVPAPASGPEPVRRPVASSYVRDPEVLGDWPQAEAVNEVLRAFTDRWGSEDEATTSMFRRVEPVGGSSEQAFAFVIDPEGKGKETSLLARACLSSAEAERPSRLWVTKYFDHMGERFRADVAKTPQASRGIIVVRDVPPDRAGKGSVALDYIASLSGDPYDDIHVDDVTQFKNLINIMRMFA